MQIYRDGDQWCATEEDFIDLQESPVGFGDTQLQAKDALIAELKMLCRCPNNGAADCEACIRIKVIKEDWEELSCSTRATRPNATEAAETTD
uniref:Uncharacterized protein n=1 Tax=viral metagenome TaxID=1070528 RepID=A0A6M3LLS5_9ZZZZ